MNALEAKIRSKQWKKFIKKLLEGIRKKEPPDTTTGDASLGLLISPIVWAKEKYYLEGLAFLKKYFKFQCRSYDLI